MNSIEMDSRFCILECDGPGHLDERAKSETGLVLMVVRSYCSHLRAKDLSAPSITNFDGVMTAATESFGRGLYVISDRAVKYVARLLTSRPALVIFEGIEYLYIPNCPNLNADTVWMTKFSSKRVSHRGWANDCFERAIQNDAVIRRRSSRPAQQAPIFRELYFDFHVSGSESSIVIDALSRGDTNLAIRAFPGRFEDSKNYHDNNSNRTGSCPICYETPVPRITTMCCKRDFCLTCAAKSMGDSSSCPWCRRKSGLWNCSIEPGHAPAPFKDALLVDTVRRYLGEGPDTRVLIVTTDDVYTFNVRTNPLMVFNTCCIGGSAGCVELAMKALEDDAGTARVGIADADRMLCCGMAFPQITHVIFTEKASFDGEKLCCWMAACPNAVEAKLMVSIVDA